MFASSNGVGVSVLQLLLLAYSSSYLHYCILPGYHYLFTMSTSTISSTTLCLACSSSMPPFKSSLSLFITSCCNRPICPQCLQSNPRLARHNPCLACLSGVGAINTTSRNLGKQVVNLNVDGAVRDEDNFAIGDDEEEEEEKVEDQTEPSQSGPPPPYPESTPLSTAAEEAASQRLNTNANVAGGGTSTSPKNHSQEMLEESARSGPSKYYIKSSDSLQGIALRFGLKVPF